ncbi:hypothetical protein [Mesorhizobium sp. KR1-2]|uniref:hypothetical protein n=1 Tax=Mesorhizobium sp. KR1-2 TaxID=3156609 RepID=UPI0032B4E98A
MRALVSHLLDALGGLTIIEAEGVLDGARHLVWLYTFTGRPLEAIAAEAKSTQEAVDTAVLLLAEIAALSKPGEGDLGVGWRMHQGFALCDAILTDARLMLYVVAYQHDMSSRFGRHAASWREEAARYSGAPGQSAPH